MNYVLLCDIKGSSRLPARKLHSKLNQLCKEINQRFNLAVPMVITLGDEWQMVCQSRTQCLEVLEYTKKTLGRIKFRAVVGKYTKPTEYIGSLKKFNDYMKTHHANPLIGEDFIRAHDQLDSKSCDLIILV
jgi:hypothetical protein